MPFTASIACSLSRPAGDRRWAVKRLLLVSAVVLAISVTAGTGVPAGQAECPPAAALVASPNVGSGGNTLWGVKTLSPTDAWAVGSFRPSGGGAPSTLTQHWDGAAW